MHTHTHAHTHADGSGGSGQEVVEADRKWWKRTGSGGSGQEVVEADRKWWCSQRGRAPQIISHSPGSRAGGTAVRSLSVREGSRASAALALPPAGPGATETAARTRRSDAGCLCRPPEGCGGAPGASFHLATRRNHSSPSATRTPVPPGGVIKNR